MKTFRVLILEDDIETISILMKDLVDLEKELIVKKRIDIAVTVLSEYTQVQEYINKTNHPFDVILLDRDCKATGSFHVIDFEKFCVGKIIGISSTPPYNEEIRERGVTRIVHKDFSNLQLFSQQVMAQLREMLTWVPKLLQY